MSNQSVGDGQSGAESRGAGASARNVAEAPARVAFRQEGRALLASLSGTWALEEATPRFDRAMEDRPADPPVDSLRFDTTSLGS